MKEFFEFAWHSVSSLILKIRVQTKKSAQSTKLKIINGQNRRNQKSIGVIPEIKIPPKPRFRKKF
ncbi:hypothetical protein HYN43_004215 [Mucilaginibacter celer]|uniref:Uncharacterized protein n=1 Tax=Mucilaginibacter celer TaxID=2305508 RepID=A0A494VJS3_9SPHI|nr:hypothetical protein HYN43_004215 [Mucilaginibacter celer]